MLFAKLDVAFVAPLDTDQHSVFAPEFSSASALLLFTLEPALVFYASGFVLAERLPRCTDVVLIIVELVNITISEKVLESGIIPNHLAYAFVVVFMGCDGAKHVYVDPAG